VSYLSFLYFIKEKKKKKELTRKRRKRKKNRKSKVIELGMTSIPLRHALLNVTLWGNIAIGKACAHGE